MSWQEDYTKRFYDPARGWVDGTTQFHQLVRDACPPGGRLLEIGAGPPNRTSRFLATLGELHGVDIDPDVANNDALESAHTIERDRYPFPDAHFDGCVSNYVVEHVEQPLAHLREIARVLRPGGAYVFRTPNAYHYVALVSRLTPHWFHVAVANRLRNLKGAHDPYPTVYAMNTKASVSRLAEQTGFRVETLDLIEKEPSYGQSSRALFLGFVGYERLVNSSDRVAFLRSNLFVVLRKR